MSDLTCGPSDSIIPCCIPLARYLYLAGLREVSEAYLCPQNIHSREKVFSWKTFKAFSGSMCSAEPVPFSHPKLLPGETWALGKTGTKNYMLWTSPRRKHHADFIQAKSSGVFYADFLNWWLRPFLHLALIRVSPGASCSTEPPSSEILQSSQEAKQTHKVSN